MKGWYFSIKVVVEGKMEEHDVDLFVRGTLPHKLTVWDLLLAVRRHYNNNFRKTPLIAFIVENNKTKQLDPNDALEKLNGTGEKREYIVKVGTKGNKCISIFGLSLF
jgi:hypothetical protein